MDAVLSKAGSFLFARKASNIAGGIADDASSLSTSVSEGATRFINRMKEFVEGAQNVLPEKSERNNPSLTFSFAPDACGVVLEGKVQTPLPELLQKYQIPKGLFPSNVLNYEFNETTGKLAVILPFVCEARFRDDSLVRYDKKVTGVLTTGVLKNIEGMKTKIMMMWSKVISVTMDKPEATKVVFVSSMNKSRPRDAYIVLRDGIEVDDF